jgi:hypothetical protein
LEKSRALSSSKPMSVKQRVQAAMDDGGDAWLGSIGRNPIRDPALGFDLVDQTRGIASRKYD